VGREGAGVMSPVAGELDAAATITWRALGLESGATACGGDAGETRLLHDGEEDTEDLLDEDVVPL
jgi:hypothetical protein